MRIAIIDDLPVDREHLSADICRWAGEQSLPLAAPPDLFESGEEFLDKFSAGKYDVVFLDIYMDGINGMDTARKIRETDTVCRLIFTTTTSEFAVDSYDVDSSWYLVKPYSYENFPGPLTGADSRGRNRMRFFWYPESRGKKNCPSTRLPGQNMSTGKCASTLKTVRRHSSPCG